MSLAIAYHMKRKKKMAEGGEAEDNLYQFPKKPIEDNKKISQQRAEHAEREEAFSREEAEKKVERNRREDISASRTRHYVGDEAREGEEVPHWAMNDSDRYAKKAATRAWGSASGYASGLTRHAYNVLQSNDRPLSERPGRRERGRQRSAGTMAEDYGMRAKVDTASNIQALREMKKKDRTNLAEGGLVDRVMAKRMAEGGDSDEGAKIYHASHAFNSPRKDPFEEDYEEKEGRILKGPRAENPRRESLGTHEYGAEKDDMKGIHKAVAVGRPGESWAGRQQRYLSGLKDYNREDNGRLKHEHKSVLREIQEGKAKDRTNLAHGGMAMHSGHRGNMPGHNRYDEDLDHPRGPDGACMAHGGQCESSDTDMVGRIMKRRMSEGGRVANDDHVLADFAPNEFDDLALDDDLEEHYTGDNSGDECDDEQENDDRHDIVSRIMNSRKKKDRNPRPA